ncbi:MAG: ligase-associated DNA damage response endonuclease PdeM [Bacteroidota bacterium]
MNTPILHTIHNQKLWLSGQRSIFWEEQKTLILSDLHFGKTGHFRKAGIAVPQNVYKEDLQRLLSLIQYFNPVQLIVVGDFFHSKANNEMDWFKKWRNDFASLKIILVKGNHDILKDRWYSETNIEVVQKTLAINSFAFTHDNCDADADAYTFCGHIHPGITLYGAGKQSMRLPCFYFTKKHCILPAFSRFTGTATIKPAAGENVFAIVENGLVTIQ